MKKIFYLLVFSLASLYLNAQTKADLIVVDPAHVASITAAAEIDREAYEDIKENQRGTIGLLEITDILNAQIKAIEDTTLHYMKEVQSVLRQVYTLEMIVQKTVRIGDNIVEMGQLVVNDPSLSLIVIQMAESFEKELTSLGYYISDIVLRGGTNNLMNNFERLKIVTHVDNKLSKLEGISLVMLYRLKYAKRHGVLHTLFPVLFAYERRNQQLAEQIISNMHFH